MDPIEHPAIKYRHTTTNSGVNIYSPGQFTPKDVRLSDIADGLSKMCRFNGQIRGHYSVAEHSVLVSEFALIKRDFEAVIPALFHDAHEAYCGDMPTPHKDMVLGFREFEGGYERVVREAFCLPGPDDPVWGRIRQYDTMILHREVYLLRDIRPVWYDASLECAVPAEIQPRGLEWPEARALFAQACYSSGYGFVHTRGGRL